MMPVEVFREYHPQGDPEEKEGYAIYAFACNPGATFSDQINEDDEVHQQLHTP